jgi:hypothetical protein
MLQKANEQYHKASDFPQDEKPYRKVEDQRWKIKPAEPIGLLKLVIGISGGAMNDIGLNNHDIVGR